MKKSLKKLVLNRETLRSLESDLLHGRVVGGTYPTEPTKNHTFCLTDCPWCPGDTATSCGFNC